MIQALIVDDDKIIRKGMISVIPWERFGIEIAGDLGSGKSALSFLKENSVDLVFVDIAMPGMNGIELIREIRARRLDCTVVVLTFYDNFEYIQETLRLGASDYLLKTQLDDRKIGEMLKRITGIIREEKKAPEALPSRGSLYAIIPTKPRDRAVGLALEALSIDVRETMSLGDGAILLRLEETDKRESEAARIARECGVYIAKISGSASFRPRDLQRIGNSLRKSFFYEYRSHTDLCVIAADTLFKNPLEGAAEEIADLRRRWSSICWLLGDEMYKKLVRDTERLRPDVLKLESIIFSARTEIANAFPLLEEHLARADSAEGFSTWVQWRDLTEKIRETVKQRVIGMKHSDEIARKVFDAVEIIRKTHGRLMKEETIASMVGFSRSYFSRCFKDITGIEYKKYLTNKSIAEAKSQLIKTNTSFKRISAQLGYQNDGHFRKIFRSSAGMTPIEFRKLYR